MSWPWNGRPAPCWSSAVPARWCSPKPDMPLARHARVVVARLDNAEQELMEITAKRTGRLRLGSFPTALATFVPAVLGAFRRAHPEVAVTVVDDHLQRLLPRLELAELDLAIVFDHHTPPTPGSRSPGPRPPVRRPIPGGSAQWPPAGPDISSPPTQRPADRGLDRWRTRECLVSPGALCLRGCRVRPSSGAVLRRLRGLPVVRRGRHGRGGHARPRP